MTFTQVYILIHCVVICWRILADHTCIYKMLNSNMFSCFGYASLSLINDNMFIQVVIADESHFLKNAQAKRTNACVPILQVYFSCGTAQKHIFISYNNLRTWLFVESPVCDLAQWNPCLITANRAIQTGFFFSF